MKTNWNKGVAESITAEDGMTKNWVFDPSESDELMLAYYMGKVAEKQKMDANDLQHLFPATLRMLKSTSDWA